jgi:epoxide hydrolase
VPRSPNVQDLCAYWAEAYDWRRAEAALNAAGSFRTEIDGLGIHFLHARSRHEDALPLVLTHGWPGSVVEFLKAIGPLIDSPDPADAFHVVCPSLPGYGFSDRPAAPGWGVPRIAGAWAELMRRLGYGRYGEHVAGIHLNMAFPDKGTIEAAGEPTAQERAALKRMAEHRATGAGYSAQQSTRPQTLGYGLVDSPAAQCAWIVEKYGAWTDSDGDPANVLSRDEMLDNVMLHWLPATGASSARLYWESFGSWPDEPIDVPAGFSVFPQEIYPVSRRWLEHRLRDLRHYRVLDRGGHFAAFEQPALYVDEVRTFFSGLR